VTKSGGARARAGAMLAPMRRILGLLGLALVVPWVACEDRTVALSDAPSTTGSSSGGTAGSTSSSSSASLGSSSSTQSSSTGGSGFPTFGSTGLGPHPTTGTTGSYGFGSGGDFGDNDVDGGMNHGADSGGSSGEPIGGVTGGGNEGGQGPDCQDPECRVCLYALSDCNIPTLECPDTEDWLWKCNKCGIQCPSGSNCFQGFKCREACSEGGICELGEYCDPVFNTCVHCVDDTHCSDFGQVCLAGECVKCKDNDGCTEADRPYCIAGQCRECISSADCGGDTCNPQNRCIECFDDDECDDESLPFCVQNACTECRYDEDCDEDEACSFFTCSARN